MVVTQAESELRWKLLLEFTQVNPLLISPCVPPWCVGQRKHPHNFVGVFHLPMQLAADLADEAEERHVELDGDHHGPMANQMINELCGDDGKKWDQARRAATQSLTARIELWDSVFDGISSNVVSKTA